MQAKTVILYDYNSHGHHIAYQALIAKLLLQNGYRVWLFCGKPDAVMDTLLLKDDELHLKDRVEGFPIEAPAVARGIVFRNLCMGWTSWRQAARQIESISTKKGCRAHFTLFLSAADFSRGFLTRQFVERIYPHPWGALMIHLQLPHLFSSGSFMQTIARGLQCHRRWYYQPLDIYNAAHCQCFLTLQEDCLDKLHEYIPGKAFLFPDISSQEYTVDAPVFKSILDKAGGRKIISLIGNQNYRKGTFVLLEIARRCSNRDWFFLWAGKDDYQRGNKKAQSLVQRVQTDQ
ncbi:MAG: hypothetical protein K8I00_11890, partial [Candidatus Omnitrophica bacterium]|nr:hypothetical protein [Candidatus Omnitrophota bacterium]